MDKRYGKKLSSLIYESLWIFFIASLLHFGYSATGFFPLSFISNVNESVWEHTKIVFFAALLFNIYLYFRLHKGNSCFIAGLAPSTFSILLSIPLMFYGYTGLLGFDAFIPDLLIAYLSALLCQAILNHFALDGRDCRKYQTLSLLFIVLLIFTFFLFTWYPLKLPMFITPK